MKNIQYHLIENNFTKANNRKIEYIVIHFTAGVSSKVGKARDTAAWFNNPVAKCSAHYIVDDGLIVQAVADTNIAWHCGANAYKHPFCRNSNSIGIEICSNHDNFISYAKTPASDPGWYFTKEEVKIAAELTADLMKKYNIPIEKVLRHYDVTGKDCPAIWVDENKEGKQGWYNFLMLVSNIVKEGVTVYKTIEDIPKWGKEAVQYMLDNKYLTGTGNGDLNIDNSMLRCLVIIYRIIKIKEGK